MHQLPPSINGFDHVIVEFEVENEKFWVDPTLSHQGGLADNMTKLNYGHILPIREGQQDLVRLDVPNAELPRHEVWETYEVLETDDVGLNIVIKYVYREVSADSIRVRIASQGREDLARGFLDYYSANYPGATETGAFTITDDLDLNEVTLVATYTVDAETFKNSDFSEELPIHATAVQDVIPRQVEAERTAPLQLYNAGYRHVIRIVTPGRNFGVPSATTMNVGEASYTRTFSREEDTLVLDYTLFVEESVVDLQDISDITRLGDEIVDESDLVIYLANAVPNEAENFGLETEIDAATEGVLARIDELMDDDEHIDAMVQINMLLEKFDEPTDVRGLLLLKKALVLEEMDRDRAAIAPFSQAFELYTPTSPDPFFEFMNVLRVVNDNARIVQVLGQMLEHHPAAVDRLNMDWFGRLAGEFADEGSTEEFNNMVIAIARAAHKVDPDEIDEFGWVFQSAIEELARRGDADEASQYLEYVKHPDFFAQLLTNRNTAEIWEATAAVASEDLTKAISNYVAYTMLQANISPEDYTTLTSHLNALRIAGRYAEAAKFAELYVNQWGRIEAVGRDAYWFINEATYANWEAGRTEEALKMITRLVNFGVRENSDLISMAINRAGLLMNAGRFEEALEAAEEIESLDSNYASNYGWMWVYDVKACSLHQLGRTAEARVVLFESMEPIAESNTSAHTKTLLCLGDYDEAAEVLVKRLRDPFDSGQTIVSFSGSTEERKYDTEFLAELRRRAAEVKKRPDVQAVFDEVGRAIAINGASAYWGDY